MCVLVGVHTRISMCLKSHLQWINPNFNLNCQNFWIFLFFFICKNFRVKIRLKLNREKCVYSCVRVILIVCRWKFYCQQSPVSLSTLCFRFGRFCVCVNHWMAVLNGDTVESTEKCPANVSRFRRIFAQVWPQIVKFTVLHLWILTVSLVFRS